MWKSLVTLTGTNLMEFWRQELIRVGFQQRGWKGSRDTKYMPGDVNTIWLLICHLNKTFI